MDNGYDDGFETYQRADLYVRVSVGSTETDPDDRGYVTSSDEGPLARAALNLTAVSAPVAASGLGYSELTPPAAAAAAAAAPASGNNNNNNSGLTWNEEFQRLNDDRTDSAEHWASLAALAHDFFQTSQHYAAIIISEGHLPDFRKTIRQCTTMGGTAGGLKYIAGGVLFKFAHDPLLGARHLYSGGAEPDAEAAAKALGQELKGAAGYYWSGVEGLCFPLMAVIDYMGFRVLAVSLLPISKVTLKYGSDSGGRIARALDPQLNSLMKKAGEKLNLAPHVVGSSKTVIHGPGDIEGHCGTDGRYYVLDFGRVYPCEAPGPASAPGSIFYQLLRPELCRQSKAPLCSDAFTGFCRFDPNSQQYCEHVKTATHVLFFKEIPEFAERAGEVGYELELIGREHMVREFVRRFSLVVELHRCGINVRHLGRVRFISTSALVRRVVLSECVFRVVKNAVRASMRQLLNTLSLPRVSPFQQLLCDTYNLILGASPAFWESEVATRLRRKFGERVLQGSSVDPISHEKLLRRPGAAGAASSAARGSEEGLSVKALVDEEYILLKLNAYFGGIEESALRNVVRRQTEVSLYDFGAFNPSVKHLGLTHYAAGRSLAIRGMQQRLSELEPPAVAQRLRYLKEARHNLLQVLLTSPDSVATLLLLARIDLFPCSHFADTGDLHLVEVGLRRAIEHLRLAQRYAPGSCEAAALLAVAASKYMQFCTSHYSAEMHQLFSVNLVAALRQSPTALDEFFWDTLRERNAIGRQFLLSEVERQNVVVTAHYCDGCKKQIVLRSRDMRWRCTVCKDYDFCERCRARRPHPHPFVGIPPSEHQRSSLSSSSEEKQGLASLLAQRVRAASRDLVRLAVADTNLDARDLEALDWSQIAHLDVQGCRRLRDVPAAAVRLVSLNVSNCNRLSKEAVAVLERNPGLAELRAKGLVGEWDEAGLVAGMVHLQLLDVQRRTFLERFVFHSEHALERVFLTNASHVGGVIVSPALLSVHAQGSELVSAVTISAELVVPNLLALSQRVELQERPEEVDLRGSGSKLAQFLRKHHSNSRMSFNKLPSPDSFLHIHSPVVREVRLDNSAAVGDLVVLSDTLQVLSLFRCSIFRPQEFVCPRLTTLYVSQWNASAEQITSFVALLPPSMLNVFFCEVAAFENAHLDAMLARLPQLRYLNLFKSGSGGGPELAVRSSASLSELSVEQCAHLRSLRVEASCAGLRRVVATGVPLLGSLAVAPENKSVRVFVERKCAASLQHPQLVREEPVQLWPFPLPVEVGEVPYVPPQQKTTRK